jgi:hypothetical protein
VRPVVSQLSRDIHQVASKDRVRDFTSARLISSSIVRSTHSDPGSFLPDLLVMSRTSAQSPNAVLLTGGVFLLIAQPLCENGHSPPTSSYLIPTHSISLLIRRHIYWLDSTHPSILLL